MIKFKKLSENYLDKKFLKYYKNYIFQSILIFVCISIIILMHDFFGAAIIASIGASSFTLFINPHKKRSHSKYVIGGYICGAIIGILFSFLYSAVLKMNFTGADYVLILICGASVTVCVFLMIILNLEHPSGASLALGLASNSHSITTALGALAGILILCSVRRLLKNHLMNL